MTETLPKSNAENRAIVPDQAPFGEVHNRTDPTGNPPAMKTEGKAHAPPAHRDLKPENIMIIDNPGDQK